MSWKSWASKILTFFTSLALATALVAAPKERNYRSVYDSTGQLVERLVLVDGKEMIVLDPSTIKQMTDEISFSRNKIELLERRKANDDALVEQYKLLVDKRSRDLEHSRQEIRTCYATLDALSKTKIEPVPVYETPMFSYFLGNLTCVAAFVAWESARSP